MKTIKKNNTVQIKALKKAIKYGLECECNQKKALKDFEKAHELDSKEQMYIDNINKTKDILEQLVGKRMEAEAMIKILNN